MHLDDFTMIIPTHRCPVMLGNLLELYSAQGVAFRIVVADSSSQEIQEQNAAAVARYSGTVRHARFEPGLSAYKKFAALPDLVETAFGMYAADDDVAILSGVRQAVGFMRERPDFSACHGVYYNARRHDAESLKIDTEYAVVSHDMADPFARLLSLSMRYQSMFYAVMRRETLARTRVPLTIRSGHFYELYNGYRLLVEGKVAGLRAPYMVRNSLQGDLSLAQLDRDPSVWIAKDSDNFWGHGYLPFRTELAAALTPMVTAERAGNLVDIIYAMFFARMYSSDLTLANLTGVGLISSAAAAVLAALRNLPNASDPPSEEVGAVVRHLAARGWPAYE